MQLAFQQNMDVKKKTFIFLFFSFLRLQTQNPPLVGNMQHIPETEKKLLQLLSCENQQMNYLLIREKKICHKYDFLSTMQLAFQHNMEVAYVKKY